MAGIIDVRYDITTHLWTAKPRFSYDMESMLHGAPSAAAPSYTVAVYKLCDLLPLEMANRIRRHMRFYRSPEYEWMDDKCIDVDGHWPSREEFRTRRMSYLTDKRIAERLKNNSNNQQTF